MSEEFELIRSEKKLKLFSYPVSVTNDKDLKTDFFIGKNDIWHNGVHFNTKDGVKSVSDGEIIAYRISNSYKTKEFDIEKIELLENLVSYAIIDPFYRSFLKLCFEFTNGVYKLKKNASEKEKEQALLLLGKLYSDSFVLIKHSVKNSEKKEIAFFSLYNHLASFKSLTYDEKLELFYFNISIKLRTITPYTKVRVFNLENNSEQFIPSETAYSDALGSDEALISWNINNTEYIGIINKKLRRDDAYCEIRRPGSGDKYLKEGQYRYLNDKKYLLFNNPDKSKRNVKAIAESNDVLSIKYQDLLRYIQNENEDQGIEVTHPVYKTCYIYLKIDYRKKLRDFINEKVLTQLPGSAEPALSFSYKKGFIFHNNREQSFTLYKKKNHYNELWKPLLPELEKSVVDIKDVMIKNGNNYTKVNIDYIPCETAINTKTGFTLIKWTINGKENTGFINGDFIRSDINEIKRKRYPFDNANNNLDDSYSLKGNDEVLIYNNKERTARQVIAKVSKETELYIENEDKKEFCSYIKDSEQTNLFYNGIKITYKQNNEKRSGYVFLDFKYQELSLTEVSDKNKTNMFNKQNSTIALFQKDVNDKLAAIDSSESIEIGEFITINFKLENSKDKIVQPQNKKVKKDTIIGFGGYYFDEEDENGEKKTEKGPLPIHFETFVETANLDFMDFNKQNNVLYPGFCKIKNPIELYKGELKAVTEQKDISSLLQQLYPDDLESQNSSSISNVCLKVNKNGQLVEGEVFYEVKIIGKIIPFEPEEYILRSDIGTAKAWNEQERVYIPDSTKNVQVYTFNDEIEESTDSDDNENSISEEDNLENGENAVEESRIISTGKTITLDKDFFYIESYDFSSQENLLNQTIKDQPDVKEQLGIVDIPAPGELNLSATDYKKRLRRPEFYFEKIDSNELFYITEKTFSNFDQRKHKDDILIYVYKDKTLFKSAILSKPEGTVWTNGEQNVNSGNYEYSYKVVKEYSSFDSNDTPETTWRQLKNGDTKYFCDDELIKDSESASDIELVYYDEWKRFFKEIKLVDFGDYKCKKGNRTKLFETLGITGDAEKSVCENIKDDNVTYNLYFENETEWKKDDNRIEELKKIAANSEAELKSEAKDFDIFKEISKHFKKATRFVYFQPCAFLNHLDKVLSLSEFNPYEKYKHLSPRHPDTYIKPKYVSHHNSKIEVLSNPGFAPAESTNKDSIRFPYEYNGLYYGAINWCYQCSIYPEVTTSGNPHTGIDFAGLKGTPIYSFIQGEVWATSFMGNMINGSANGGKSYGRMMLIKGNNDRLYLLGHLSAYNKKKGDSVVPGEIVAYVGNTGYSAGAHLHLEVFECDNSIEKQTVINLDANENIELKWKNSFNYRSKRVNPFNHNS